MNCFECAKTHDSVPAVGLCQHCSVGLCIDHLIEAHAFHVGGTNFGCLHTFPDMKQMRGMPGGIASSRHHTAGVA